MENQQITQPRTYTENVCNCNFFAHLTTEKNEFKLKAQSILVLNPGQVNTVSVHKMKSPRLCCLNTWYTTLTH